MWPYTAPLGAAASQHSPECSPCTQPVRAAAQLSAPPVPELAAGPKHLHSLGELFMP